ncbi:hypothetical protein JX266_012112 [Neoarthrinium moseri]|nr:hypothetical protein JX266_012112 [Neoarthrinium moseri]
MRAKKSDNDAGLWRWQAVRAQRGLVTASPSQASVAHRLARQQTGCGSGTWPAWRPGRQSTAVNGSLAFAQAAQAAQAGKAGAENPLGTGTGARVPGYLQGPGTSQHVTQFSHTSAEHPEMMRWNTHPAEPGAQMPHSIANRDGERWRPAKDPMSTVFLKR